MYISTKERSMLKGLDPYRVKVALMGKGYWEVDPNDFPPWLKGKQVTLLSKPNKQDLLVVSKTHSDWPRRMRH